MGITIEMPARPEGVTTAEWRGYLRGALAEPNAARRHRRAEEAARVWEVDPSEIRVPQTVFGD